MLISADKKYVVVLENLINVYPVEVLLVWLLSLSANADQVLEISSYEHKMLQAKCVDLN